MTADEYKVLEAIVEIFLEDSSHGERILAAMSMDEAKATMMSLIAKGFVHIIQIGEEFTIELNEGLFPSLACH